MTESPGLSLLPRVRAWLEMVRFSHTLFALPFAAIAFALAFDGRAPSLRTALLCLLCMVAARTAAMAYNRLVDRDVDAANPRTRSAPYSQLKSETESLLRAAGVTLQGSDLAS